MKKKFLPYLFLIAALVFFIWIKKHQRGGGGETDFDRSLSTLVYSKHARCRMDCRHIDEEEVKEILAKGEIIEGRTEKTSKGISYALEGVTRDKQHVRIVIAPKKEKMVVVTAIDLDRNWTCDCD